MSLVKCKECGADISSDAAACPHCGKPLAPTVRPKPQQKTSGCLVILLAIVVIGIIASIDGKKERVERTMHANSMFAQGRFCEAVQGLYSPVPRSAERGENEAGLSQLRHNRKELLKVDHE